MTYQYIQNKVKEEHQKNTNLILKTKMSDILKCLYTTNNGKIYSSRLSKLVDTTYSHTTKIVGNLYTLGLIEVHNKTGRIKEIQITQKGRQVAKRIVEIEYIMKNGEIEDDN